MGELLRETLALAKASKLPVEQICEAAGVKRRWYLKLLSGDIPEPGVNKIERLNKTLKATVRRGKKS